MLMFPSGKFYISSHGGPNKKSIEKFEKLSGYLRHSLNIIRSALEIRDGMSVSTGVNIPLEAITSTHLRRLLET